MGEPRIQMTSVRDDDDTGSGKQVQFNYKHPL